LGRYDAVHLSARNARLEEKLSKALAKNRSMAKYYDQLLAKTRDAQERELEDVKSQNRQLQQEVARSQGMSEQLARERSEREALSHELHTIRANNQATDSKRTEEYATTQSTMVAVQERLASSQAECAHLRAQLQGANMAAASPAAMGVDMGSHTVTQMQKLLDAARDERNHERAQAQARDAEMARQLSDIREQALERIRESTGAAQEVAALKERLHGAEAERNRLRDENEELRADEDERRDHRRRMNTAEEAAGKLRQKAERCDLAEAKLRAAEADRQNLQSERTDAHKRLQEMTEKVLLVGGCTSCIQITHSSKPPGFNH
jgi:chromosome segregation ATPase